MRSSYCGSRKRTLTPLFLESVESKPAPDSGSYLMFDVFERTVRDPVARGCWRCLISNTASLQTRLTFVISGRDPLEQHWTELAGALCRVPLEPFTLDETRLYLSNQGITRRTAGCADSRRYGRSCRCWSSCLPQPSRSPACRCPTSAKMPWSASCNGRRRRSAGGWRCWRPCRASSTGTSSARRWAATPPACSTGSRRRATFAPAPSAAAFYHEKVRELMLRHLRNTTPSDLAATHARLVELLSKRHKAQLDLAEKAAYDSETWRKLECERVYHAVSEQPDRNIAAIAVNAFLHAFRWRWGFAEQHRAGLASRWVKRRESQATKEMAEHIVGDLWRLRSETTTNQESRNSKRWKPVAT